MKHLIRSSSVCRRAALSVSMVAAALCATSSASAGTPNTNLEMFLDSSKLTSTSGCVRVLNQPTRMATPVIGSAGSWDPLRSFGQVTWDTSANQFKMWYQINKTPNAFAYATSTDGITWTQPNLGIVPVDPANPSSSKANNMIFRGLGYASMLTPTVIKDTADPDPNRRYKMAYFDYAKDNAGGNNNGAEGDFYGDSGVFTATSPDGLNWTRTTKPAAPQLYQKKIVNSTSDVISMMYDPQISKYVSYSKGLNGVYRQVVRTESSDFVNWSTPVPVLTHAKTQADPQSYGASVFDYQGVDVMMLPSYKKLPTWGDETIDVQLASSRDNGTSWNRVAQEGTFMPLGATGQFDDGIILPFRPFEHNGKVYMYYQGWDGPHDSLTNRPQIGLATIDSGRFVAMTNSHPTTGVSLLETTNFTFANGKLFLNVDLNDTGYIRVAMLNSAGSVITGFAGANSIITTYNDLYSQVTFAAANLASLNGQSVRVRVQIGGDAALYGYTTLASVTSLTQNSDNFAVPEPASIAVLALFGLLLRRPRPEA